jgi:hypothetical protein
LFDNDSDDDDHQNDKNQQNLSPPASPMRFPPNPQPDPRDEEKKMHEILLPVDDEEENRVYGQDIYFESDSDSDAVNDPEEHAIDQNNFDIPAANLVPIPIVQLNILLPIAAVADPPPLDLTAFNNTFLDFTGVYPQGFTHDSHQFFPFSNEIEADAFFLFALRMYGSISISLLLL